MAKVIQLLEIDLNGSSFRIEFGGRVALVEKDSPVAVVKIDTLQEAERLESFASLFHFTFRWKEHHDRSQTAISLAQLEQMLVKSLSADLSRYFQPGARNRLASLGLVPPQAPASTVAAAASTSKPEREECPGCGTTEGAFFGDYCGSCAFVENNPHGHDD